MAYEIDNSFLEEFDFMFRPYLQQQGSQLMQAVTPVEVHGAVEYFRQNQVGEARFRTDQGGTTEFTSIKHNRRRLKPRAFDCPISLDVIDMVMQGTPDPEGLAAQAANSCGILIDQIIIQGLGGTSYTEAEGEKKLSGAADTGMANNDVPNVVVSKYDKTQTISWNDCTLGGNSADNTSYVKAGLNTGKLQKAVQKLKSKYNYGPILCVGSSYAMATMRSDIRAASSDFNDIHAFMDGINNPYAGISAFIESEQVDGGKSAVKANGTGTANDGQGQATGVDVEYAYIFSMNQVLLGCSMPLTLKSGENPERNFDQVLMYTGMYDCTRMFEESVIRVEINKSPTSDAQWAN